MATINVDLLRMTLQRIVEKPWTWEQDQWAIKYDECQAERRAARYNVPVKECGSAYCLAGQVAALMGRLKIVNDDHNRYGALYAMDDGSDIGMYAQDQLGLSAEQADDLFDADNTLYDLWHFARTYTGGEIEIPESVEPNEMSRFNDE